MQHSLNYGPAGELCKSQTLSTKQLMWCLWASHSSDGHVWLIGCCREIVLQLFWRTAPTVSHHRSYWPGVSAWNIWEAEGWIPFIWSRRGSFIFNTEETNSCFLGLFYNLPPRPSSLSFMCFCFLFKKLTCLLFFVYEPISMLLPQAIYAELDEC